MFISTHHDCSSEEVKSDSNWQNVQNRSTLTRETSKVSWECFDEFFGSIRQGREKDPTQAADIQSGGALKLELSNVVLDDGTTIA